MRKSQVDKLVAGWKELDEQQSRKEPELAWGLLEAIKRNSSDEERKEALRIANGRPWRK